MDRYYQATVTTNPGVTSLAPLTTAVILENALLVDIEILIPTGHTGLTGVRVRQSGQQILPFGSSSFIVADDYLRIFDINTEVGARSISVQSYNNDIYQHTHYLRFHIRDLSSESDTTLSRSGVIIAQDINDGLAGTIDTDNPDSPLVVPGVTLPLPPPPPPALTLP